MSKNEFKFQGYHHRAIELRYDGLTYKKITSTLNDEYNREKPLQEQTVAKWFTKSGLLYDMYIEYTKAENDRRRQQMRLGLSKMQNKIPNVLEKLIFSRMEFDMFGRPVLDPETKKAIKKLDSVTIKAIAQYCTMMGITGEDAQDLGDPLDEYFNRKEKELGLTRNKDGDLIEPPQPETEPDAAAK